MFNLIKNPDIKENAEDLVDNVKSRAKEIKNEITDDIEEISAEVKNPPLDWGKK
ncbi:MAG TPA: hypothetical protein VGC12_07510 [Methyloradius sp.]